MILPEAAALDLLFQSFKVKQTNKKTNTKCLCHLFSMCLSSTRLTDGCKAAKYHDHLPGKNREKTKYACQLSLSLLLEKQQLSWKSHPKDFFPSYWQNHIIWPTQTSEGPRRTSSFSCAHCSSKQIRALLAKRKIKQGKQLALSTPYRYGI